MSVISSGKVNFSNTNILSERTLLPCYVISGSRTRARRYSTYDSQALSSMVYEYEISLPLTSRSFTWSHDGQYLFMSRNGGRQLRRYNMTAIKKYGYHHLNILSAVPDMIICGSPISTFIGMHFLDEGKLLYTISPSSSARVQRWSLSVPYDITTMTLVDTVYPFQAYGDIYMRRDGRKMFIGRHDYVTDGSLSARYIRENFLSAPHDLNTLNFVYELNLDTAISSQYSPNGFTFSRDGKYLYISNRYYHSLDKLELPEHWKLSGTSGRVDYFDFVPGVSGLIWHRNGIFLYNLYEQIPV